MSLPNSVPRSREDKDRSLTPLHFVANLRINSVLVPSFWVAALIAFIKSFYVENYFGLVIALLLAAVNTLVSFHKRQDIIRSAVIYLGSISLLIHDQEPNNAVSLCFLAVALSFLVKDKKTMQRIPYLAIFLILGYAATLIVVAFWSSKETDISVIYPELGGFVIIVLVFRDSFLPKPNHKPTFELTSVLTEAEAKYVLLAINCQSYKEIAFEKGVSPSTVRNMVARSIRKLNLKNTHDLINFANQNNVTL